MQNPSHSDFNLLRDRIFAEGNITRLRKETWKKTTAVRVARENMSLVEKLSVLKQAVRRLNLGTFLPLCSAICMCFCFYYLLASFPVDATHALASACPPVQPIVDPPILQNDTSAFFAYDHSAEVNEFHVLPQYRRETIQQTPSADTEEQTELELFMRAYRRAKDLNGDFFEQSWHILEEQRKLLEEGEWFLHCALNGDNCFSEKFTDGKVDTAASSIHFPNHVMNQYNSDDSFESRVSPRMRQKPEEDEKNSPPDENANHKTFEENVLRFAGTLFGACFCTLLSIAHFF